MDKEREQAIVTDEEKELSDNSWGVRSSVKYIMVKKRQQAIVIDEEREQSDNAWWERRS